MFPDGDWPATLTAKETAELLGVHVETLRALVRKGQSPVKALHVGRALRFSSAEVRRLLQIGTFDMNPRNVAVYVAAGERIERWAREAHGRDTDS